MNIFLTANAQTISLVEWCLYMSDPSKILIGHRHVYALL